VVVNLLPTTPGTRYGGVQLLNSSGAVIAAADVYALQLSMFASNGSLQLVLDPYTRR
jgi:hypothetical protein